MAAKGTTRKSAAPVLSLLAITALLYGVIALNGWEWKPKLGLDLRGGTSVILGPRQISGGGAVPAASVNKAVDIIRLRVNRSGVAEAEVNKEGDNIVVSIPGANRKLIEQASATAQLRFRMVQQVTGPGPVPEESTATDPSSAGVSLAPSATAPAPKPSPSPSATGAGRAVTGALVAQASATPTATGTPAPTGTPAATATPAPTGTATAPPPAGAEEANSAFLKLDCSDEEQAATAATTDNDPANAVALCHDDGSAKYLLGPTEMDGTDVSSSDATLDQNGRWIVQLDLTSQGKKKFGDLTTANVDKQFAMVLDGRVVSAPNINEPITGNLGAQIEGDFTKAEAQDLSNVLRFGALPLSFDRLSLDSISPSLGKESLRAGVLAGAIGLAAVLLYIIAYYRGLGLVTLAGLALWSALNFALVIILGEAMGFTLTLAGIAGFIISAGITSDSYIVYFERLKDEAREGRSIQSSADRGFGRAFKTIVAADTVSFLAALILYFYSAGAVRGFAFTLGLSTLLDVVIAYMFTRPIVAALSRTKLFTTGRFVGIKGTVPVASGTRRQPKEA